MSLDQSSNSQVQYKVVSKYFTSNIGMDDSLSDFQEKKNNFPEPKKTVKDSEKKAKVKKTVKKIKGQKDIRNALNGKKNDLVAYSKDFDSICKKSGIDVDSEQLQLAIALSKSLQPGNSEDNCAKSLSSRPIERSQRLRYTLQEYGFKVPDIKKGLTGKRRKNLNKQYKLLLTNVTVQNEIISAKYSRVLFENLDTCTTNCSHFDTSSLFLYNLATNIPYEQIRNNDIFYVKGCFEKTDCKLGGLLKDWSEIPGRPKSPEVKLTKYLNISKMDYSQEQLDIILSGSSENTREIINMKHNLDETMSNTENTINDAIKIDKNNDIKQIIVKEIETENKTLSDYKTSSSIIKSIETIRCVSPDLFEDEACSIQESTDNVVTSQKSQIDFMDLTECVVPGTNSSNKQTNIINFQLSQGNVTKRKSNDLMEITECVATEHLTHTAVEEKIDLTQCDDDDKACNAKEHVDLTQSSNSTDDTLPFVHLSGTNNILDNTVTLINEEYVIDSKGICLENDKLQETDVVEISLVKDVNNLTNNDVDKKSYKTSFEVINEDIVVNYGFDHSGVEKNVYKILYENPDPIKVRSLHDSGENSKDIDLTQSSDSNDTDILISNSNIQKVSFESLGKKDNVSIDYDDVISSNNSISKNENIVEKVHTDFSYGDQNDGEINKQNSIASSSNNSIAFEISDVEFNYSMNKSRLDCGNNFDLGGLSVMDDLSNIKSFNKSSGAKPSGMSINDSYLPEINVKTNSKSEDSCDILEKTTEAQNVTTPLKENVTTNVIVDTPKNFDLIIKTHNVTPLLDYASMSTPERNLELDKYGLKPFKRKRAVQLLTHLYNQTHPVVEICSETGSPSKKLKPPPSPTKIPKNITSPKKGAKSPKKAVKLPKNVAKSPRKQQKSPRKVPDFDSVKGNIHLVTTELPDIAEIECRPEDWVFQKREKAKVHSCRVPLHVAFYNYVACRRALQEAILRYEPINIDVIHKDLVADGHRYDPKDLLKYMDKKCITVKTADNNSRNANR